MKIIMRAGEIPPGAIVTKLSGNYRFRIEKSITLYDIPLPKARVIQCEETRFLVQLDGGTDRIGSISCIPTDKELVWDADISEVQKYIDNDGDEE